MATEFNHSQENDCTPLMVEMELLAALLEAENTYPWNLDADTCEAYIAQHETEMWSESELSGRATTFYAQLDQIWSHVTRFEQTPVWKQQFADFFPPMWIDAIARQAKSILPQKSLADRLVACVQELLPNWTQEDLFVLARPFAYTMRGTQTQSVEVILNNIDDRDWASLSEIEQARATFALAAFALHQVDHPQNDAQIIDPEA